MTALNGPSLKSEPRVISGSLLGPVNSEECSIPFESREPRPLIRALSRASAADLRGRAAGVGSARLSWAAFFFFLSVFASASCCFRGPNNVRGLSSCVWC